MTLQEFSIEFDILYNNISSNQAPGLTEYEKSVFLTQAQEALVLDLYKGTTGDSFETTEEVTRYLSTLVKTKKINNLTNTSVTNLEYRYTITPDTDVWFIVYQSVIIQPVLGARTYDALVVPTTHDTIYKDLRNPFKMPNKNKTLVVSEDNKLELYSKYPVISFTLKYLAKPDPIILDTIDGLTINETSGPKDCELPESLHRQILLRAVQMAKAVWQS